MLPSQRSTEGKNDKLKYLKRLQHRISGSSAGASIKQSSSCNNSETFRIQSQKQSFLDVFTSRKPIVPDISPLKTYEETPQRQYDPRRYFSQQIQAELKKVMATINNLEARKSQKKTKMEYHETTRKKISDKPTVETLAQRQTKKSVAAPVNQPTAKDEELHQCQICNRKFNINSYEKHTKICEKVFFKKRKQFKSSEQRIN